MPDLLAAGKGCQFCVQARLGRPRAVTSHHARSANLHGGCHQAMLDSHRGVTRDVSLRSTSRVHTKTEGNNDNNNNNNNNNNNDKKINNNNNNNNNEEEEHNDDDNGNNNDDNDDDNYDNNNNNNNDISTLSPNCMDTFPLAVRQVGEQSAGLSAAAHNWQAASSPCPRHQTTFLLSDALWLHAWKGTAPRAMATCHS